jgi:ABC-type transport system substrate-binding protein
VANYQPSIGLNLKRNPNFYDKERPYLDGVDRPIVSEYGVGLAQFRTGAIHYFGVSAEDVLTTKKDVPQLAMYSADIASPVNQLGGAAGARLPFIFFGWKPSPPEKTPFRDERVRQAFSMALDREAWVELKGNVSKFEAEGLPVITRWNSALDLDLDGWWMDPRDKEFGPNAKYYMHDVAEAKKLLAAAGFANGVEVISNWPPTGYGLTLAKDVEVHEGMAREAGFTFVTNNPAFNTEWAPKYRDARGNFEGLAYRGFSVSAPDAIERLASEFLSSPGLLTFTGFDANGRGDYSGDPALEEMILKGRKETDTEQRRSIVKEIQRYAAKKLYNLHPLGAANGFDLAWPAVKNYNVFRGDQREFLYNWLDQDAPPFKS